ncbi:hypothetical protein [Aurantiacibacter odishensis]|uniref:hypothetical protein n=1 Tax=Aurantiacibacter odishensis TaxID=1155476 RepID=UPI000E727663|nr:hypothetical protein [Aurantiacibacter odishensis]
MKNSKDSRLDQKLMRRLHEACRPSYSQSAFALRVEDNGDYVAQGAQKVVKHSTLGASINFLTPKRLSRT